MKKNNKYNYVRGSRSTLEFRDGVEACYRRGNGLEAITMLLPNLIENERCNGIRVNYEKK